MAGRLHPVPGQGEVLTDRTRTGEKRLRGLRIAKTLHVTLTPTRGLVTIFRAVIDAGGCLDKAAEFGRYVNR